MPLPCMPKPSAPGACTLSATCSQLLTGSCFSCSGQLARLAALQLRIPHRIDSGGEAFQSFLQRLDHALVILFFFIGRVDQHQRAARRRRQQCFQCAESVGLLHQHLRTVPGEILLQDGVVGRVKFKQPHPVLLAHGYSATKASRDKVSICHPD